VAKEDQPSWTVDAAMRRPARSSSSRTPPAAAPGWTADWGVAGYAIIEAPSVLGLFPGGVEHLPRALPDAGLADAVAARHVGVVTPPPYDPGRDAATGLLNPMGLRDDAHVLAGATCEVLDVGDLPLVLGGHCSILLGNLLALRRHRRHGLLFIDGNADFYQPDGEPNGRLRHSKG
jgi:arginase